MGMGGVVTTTRMKGSNGCNSYGSSDGEEGEKKPRRLHARDGVRRWPVLRAKGGGGGVGLSNVDEKREIDHTVSYLTFTCELKCGTIWYLLLVVSPQELVVPLVWVELTQGGI